MMSTYFRRLLAASNLYVTALWLGGASPAQSALPLEPGDGFEAVTSVESAHSMAFTFDGRGLEQEGAVVVSSAGGPAVADAF